MKVSELAEELDVPPSAVLAQCQRFGIDASWAGADLSGSDLVILRAELAGSDDIDLTTADPTAAVAAEPASEVAAAASITAAASPPASAMPPTTVGSMPELIDEITPEPEPAPQDHEGASAAARVPGPLANGGFGPDGAPTRARNSVEDRAPAKRRWDRRARSGLIALVVGAAAFVGSNLVDAAAAVVALWVIALGAFIASVIDSVRGRRQAQLHPDRFRGAWLATVTCILAVAGIVGITASVLAVGADDPDDVPAGLTDLSSVQVARWGYQRTTRLADNGWHQPARDVDTCWLKETDRDERGEDRVEQAQFNRKVSCSAPHQLEVVDGFAFNREADAPYPGEDQILLAGQKRCAATMEAIQADSPKATLTVEYPTSVGWSNGDHDITCVVVSGERTGRLAG